MENMENMEIVDLDEWIIHKTVSNNEFVSGYKFNSNDVWETSNIISKTPTQYGLFIITKTEHIYYLDYKKSY